MDILQDSGSTSGRVQSVNNSSKSQGLASTQHLLEFSSEVGFGCGVDMRGFDMRGFDMRASGIG